MDNLNKGTMFKTFLGGLAETNTNQQIGGYFWSIREIHI